MLEAPHADDPRDRPGPDRPDSTEHRAAPERRARPAAAAEPAAVASRLDELARANAALQAEIREHRRAEVELREAKERLALALEGSRLSLWDYDAVSGHLYLSEQWAQMLGDSPRAISTTLAEMFEVTHPNERESLHANYTAVLKGLIPEYKVEHRVRTRAGDWKWILSHGRVIERAGNGYARRVIGTNADITERKNAEQALADRLAELRLVQDHAPAMIAYFDSDGCCRYANRQYARFFDREPDEIIGRSSDAILEGAYPEVQPYLVRALRGETVAYERTHASSDGRRRHVVVELIPHQGADGAVLGFYGMMIDISARKRAEDQVRESEQRFRDVVEASGEYVWEADGQWRYRYLSKRAESVLGHPIEGLIGHAPSEFMPPGEALRVSRWIAANAVPGGAFTDLEHMTVTESGEIRWQWVSCKPVRDATGAVVAYRGTGANITERKRHEARIEQLATRDALTGLPNRALLADRLAHAVAGERREHGMLATMFIDVDRFKTINDSLGHHIGDALLQQMAARLVDCVREEDTVARSGGDEFVVVAGAPAPGRRRRAARSGNPAPPERALRGRGPPAGRDVQYRDQPLPRRRHRHRPAAQARRYGDVPRQGLRRRHLPVLLGGDERPRGGASERRERFAPGARERRARAELSADRRHGRRRGRRRRGARALAPPRRGIVPAGRSSSRLPRRPA